MCFTLSISILMAIIAFATAGYLLYKKESKLLWIPIAYFGIMEVLQTITYFTLGGCTPTNQILTYLSYLHIAFQPFFINAILLYFIPKHVRKKLYVLVFTIAFLATILMLVKIYPFDWAGTCTTGALCGETLCTMPGNVHFQWHMPLNGFEGHLWDVYFLSIFILPLIYGSWKGVLFNTIFGPGLAYLISNSPNEWPAIYCLLSIAIIFVVVIPSIRKKFHVKKWYFWKYPFKKR
jgi:hypothetical protein